MLCAARVRPSAKPPPAHAHLQRRELLPELLGLQMLLLALPPVALLCLAEGVNLGRQVRDEQVGPLELAARLLRRHAHGQARHGG